MLQWFLDRVIRTYAADYRTATAHMNTGDIVIVANRAAAIVIMHDDDDDNSNSNPDADTHPHSEWPGGGAPGGGCGGGAPSVYTVGGLVGLKEFCEGEGGPGAVGFLQAAYLASSQSSLCARFRGWRSDVWIKMDGVVK